MGLFDFLRKKDGDSSKNEEYEKVKKLSFWIFNTYGIPVRMSVQAGNNKDKYDFKLFSKLPFKVDRISDFPSVVNSEMIYKIIDEYLFEYTHLNISFNDNNFKSEYVDTKDSIFVLIKREIYDSEAEFLTFDFEKLSNLYFSSKLISILQNAKAKILAYQMEFGDLNKPKLILPSPGLSFEEFKIANIRTEAEREEVSYDEYFTEIKSEVDSVTSDKFIPFSKIYDNEIDLMTTTRWRKGFCYLDINNEIIFEPSNSFYGE